MRPTLAPVAPERSTEPDAPPEIEIVRATSGHALLVSPLFDLYRRFYEQDPDPQGAERFITERLERGDSVIFLALLRDSGEQAAAGFVQLYPIFSSVSMRRLWLLNDLYVSAEVRRRGVARALIECAAAFARETGAKGLILETAADNGPAQRLYEGLGWAKDVDHFYYALQV